MEPLNASALIGSRLNGANPDLFFSMPVTILSECKKNVTTSHFLKFINIFKASKLFRGSCSLWTLSVHTMVCANTISRWQTFRRGCWQYMANSPYTMSRELYDLHLCQYDLSIYALKKCFHPLKEKKNIICLGEAWKTESRKCVLFIYSWHVLLWPLTCPPVQFKQQNKLYLDQSS